MPLEVTLLGVLFQRLERVRIQQVDTSPNMNESFLNVIEARVKFKRIFQVLCVRKTKPGQINLPKRLPNAQNAPALSTDQTFFGSQPVVIMYKMLKVWQPSSSSKGRSPRPTPFPPQRQLLRRRPSFLFPCHPPGYPYSIRAPDFDFVTDFRHASLPLPLSFSLLVLVLGGGAPSILGPHRPRSVKRHLLEFPIAIVGIPAHT